MKSPVPGGRVCFSWHSAACTQDRKRPPQARLAQPSPAVSLARRDVLRRRRDGGWLVKVAWRQAAPLKAHSPSSCSSHSRSRTRTPPLSQHIATQPSTNLPSLRAKPASMEARVWRDFEALERSEAAAAMAEAREWERVAAEAAAGRVKYRGVRKVPSGKYKAEIQDPVTKKQVWLGTFEAALVAACAYDLQARRLQAQLRLPPAPGLVSAVAATPRRRGHSHPAPPAPPALAPSPFIGLFSFQAPATSEPAPFQAYPCKPSQHVPRPARARLVLRSPAAAPEMEITVVRSIPPESFSFKATAAASPRVNDPVNLFAPPMHMVAPTSSAKTCFSSAVDPKLRDSASSSYRPRPLMLKKPKVMAVPTTTTTTPTNADCEFTGDNFTGVAVPWFF